MKGIVKEIKVESVKMKDGTNKDKYLISFEGDDKTYECWSGSSLKVGDEAEGEVTSREYNGKTYYGIKLKAAGGSGYYKPTYAGSGKSAVETFAAAYTKDLIVCLINKDMIKTSVEITASLEHFYPWFLNKMKGA